jgi:hypothetical protein
MCTTVLSSVYYSLWLLLHAAGPAPRSSAITFILIHTPFPRFAPNNCPPIKPSVLVPPIKTSVLWKYIWLAKYCLMTNLTNHMTSMDNAKIVQNIRACIFYQRCMHVLVLPFGLLKYPRTFSISKRGGQLIANASGLVLGSLTKAHSVAWLCSHHMQSCVVRCPFPVYYIGLVIHHLSCCTITIWCLEQRSDRPVLHNVVYIYVCILCAT